MHHHNNNNTYICLLYGSFWRRYVTCRYFKRQTSLSGGHSLMGGAVLLPLVICSDGLVYNESYTAGELVTN